MKILYVACKAKALHGKYLGKDNANMIIGNHNLEFWRGKYLYIGIESLFVRILNCKVSILNF